MPAEEKGFFLANYSQNRKGVMLSVKYNNELLKNVTCLNRVFVYGTLLKSFRNHERYLKGRIHRITPGKTHGLLYHLPEGYPALIKGNEIIRGEIVEPVDEELLKSLDWLEGFDEGRRNNLYERYVRKVFTDEGEEMNCWIYFYTNEKYARENGIPVPGGDWRKFMEKKGELI